MSDVALRGEYGPAPCPVCGSVGARALMLDHIEDAHPGQLLTRADADNEIRSLRRDYTTLQEQSGQAIVRAHVSRGHVELREQEMFEQLRAARLALWVMAICCRNEAARADRNLRLYLGSEEPGAG